MPRPKKETIESVNDTETAEAVRKIIPSPNEIEWTDHVLGLLSDDEKIAGNPTTDGLRRIFEIALDCVITDSSTTVVQSPSPENEKRATVVHSLTFVLKKDGGIENHLNVKSVSGAADVYWGNCDKIYRNHPVAVAETRAEGRALRRGLKLRKVVAAEEIAKDIEDNPDHDTITKITNNQINFIDVLAKRLDINAIKLINSLALNSSNIYNIAYEDAVGIVQALTNYQQKNDIPQELVGYSSDWK